MQFVALQVEEAHAFLAEISWMVSVHGSPVIAQPTSITSTARMFTIASHTSTSTAHGSSQLADFSESGSHAL